LRAQVCKRPKLAGAARLIEQAFAGRKGYELLIQ
jgi:hypothetical protein